METIKNIILCLSFICMGYKIGEKLYDILGLKNRKGYIRGYLLGKRLRRLLKRLKGL